MKCPVLATLLLVRTAFAADALDANLDALLAYRVDQQKQAVSMVVGIIDRANRYVVGRGRLQNGGTGQPDGDSLFETGSITKVFTSLLLAEMVGRGEVALEDPVAKYLPSGLSLPSRNGRQVTLQDLSMQVSGLPSIPDNFKPADMANPYSDYRAHELYDFLSRYTLTRDIGEKYEYSNLGAGLGVWGAAEQKTGLRIPGASFCLAIL